MRMASLFTTPIRDFDLIGWTDELELLHLGGHRPLGWLCVAAFGTRWVRLPGQPDWRFCGKCHGLVLGARYHPKATAPVVVSTCHLA